MPGRGARGSGAASTLSLARLSPRCRSPPTAAHTRAWRPQRCGHGAAPPGCRPATHLGSCDGARRSCARAACPWQWQKTGRPQGREPPQASLPAWPAPPGAGRHVCRVAAAGRGRAAARHSAAQARLSLLPATYLVPVQPRQCPPAQRQLQVTRWHCCLGQQAPQEVVFRRCGGGGAGSARLRCAIAAVAGRRCACGLLQPLLQVALDLRQGGTNVA